MFFTELNNRYCTYSLKWLIYTHTLIQFIPFSIQIVISYRLYFESSNYYNRFEAVFPAQNSFLHTWRMWNTSYLHQQTWWTDTIFTLRADTGIQVIYISKLTVVGDKVCMSPPAAWDFCKIENCWVLLAGVRDFDAVVLIVITLTGKIKEHGKWCGNF